MGDGVALGGAAVTDHPKIKDRNRTERLQAFPDVYTDEVFSRAMKHLAEEKGEDFDPASVSGPMVMYQIEGDAAVVGR